MSSYHPSKNTVSVRCLGARNPADTADFKQRAQANGIVDLTGGSTTTASHAKRKGDEFSTPAGKRKKVQHVTTNLSHYCVTLEQKWSQGAFRWVHKGMYQPDPRYPGDTGGLQNGELCVLKEFKTGSVYEHSFFENDINAVEKAEEAIEAFNSYSQATHRVPGTKMTLFNKPQVWEGVYPDATGRKSKKLVEPMLEGEFLKFNSNSGYTNGADFMQALSHFSYHHTGGQYLLCDLQGGHYEDSYILTDPVIMSQDDSKKYGATDLGSEGIQNFFAHHKCNRFCSHHWKKPQRVQASARIPHQAGTSMSLTIGTKKSVIDRKQALDAILAKKHW